MARSEGNIALVGDLLERGISARALRYALISAHYRASLSYTDESLSAAATRRSSDSTPPTSRWPRYREDRADDPTLPDALEAARTAFGAALDDDLNISPALAAVFDLVRDLNRRIDARTMSTADAEPCRRPRCATSIASSGSALTSRPTPLEPDIQALIDARAAARAARDWAASDRLRDELAERGIVIEDLRDGQRWRRAGVTSDA